MIDGRRGQASKPAAPGAVEGGPSGAPPSPAVVGDQVGGGATGSAEVPGAPGRSGFDPRRLQIGAHLVRRGISADHVTALGVLLAAVNAVVIGSGLLYLGTVLLIVGGLMDTLDGAVAKAGGTASARGAFLDSVADRVADALLFGGLAYYFASRRHPVEALATVGVLAAGSVISYERAKAESLGFQARGGLMERAERLIGLGCVLTLHFAMVPILWALLVLTLGTAVGRFLRVWRQASAAEAHPRASVRHSVAGRGTTSRFGHSRVHSRWRELRETGSAEPWRLSGAPGARWRNRRRSGTLSTRLRGVLGAELGVGTRHGTSGGSRAGERARAARAFRRRMDDGRSR